MTLRHLVSSNLGCCGIASRNDLFKSAPQLSCVSPDKSNESWLGVQEHGGGNRTGVGTPLFVAGKTFGQAQTHTLSTVKRTHPRLTADHQDPSHM